MPIIDGLQDYFEYVEERVYASVSAVAGEMPMIHEALNRLWVDVARFGPTLPEIHLPGLGEYEVPPPPPPPPPPLSAWERGVEWVGAHPWKAASLSVGFVGVGLLVGYNRTRARTGRRARSAQAGGDRRKVVVVLGGDTPLALPLISDLEQKGFIVIASVATPEAADELEHKCAGFVRALVLDPTEPATVPFFLRSLASTLNCRFPINAPGDPHASPSTHPYIHSIVSLLSLSTPAPPPAPLEHLPLRDSYLEHLTAAHTTPLQVVQALLPLLRGARTRDFEQRTIIICIPAAARIGLPFAAARAMGAAATARGAEVLRREMSLVNALRGVGVVLVDVGAVDAPLPTRRRLLGGTEHDATAAWTPSERAAYGPAYATGAEVGAVGRRPANVREFVRDLADVVSSGRVQSVSLFGARISVGPLLSWVCGDRYAVGAGATTYALASWLPTALLDVIVTLPHRLLSLRSALHTPAPAPRTASPVPAPTPATKPAPAPTPATKPAPAPAQFEPQPQAADSEPEHALSEAEHDTSETGSEADVESNADGAGVGGSWVNLKNRSRTAASSSQAGDT